MRKFLKQLFCGHWYTEQIKAEKVKFCAMKEERWGIRLYRENVKTGRHYKECKLCGKRKYVD